MGKAALRFSRKCGVILVSVAEFMFEQMLYGPSLVPDVVIGGWSRPWNLRGDRAVGGAPPSALWATDPAGFGQVGCVYTAQGFEYDWNEVIVGPDLVWRDGRWAAVRDANKDPNLRIPRPARCSGHSSCDAHSQTLKEPVFIKNAGRRDLPARQLSFRCLA